MTEIIPTILVKDFKEVKERIKVVEKYVNWVQLDIMDGAFVYNETWPHSAVPGIAKRGEKYSKEIEKLKKLNPPAGGKVKIEIHLMVDKPEEEIDDWLKIADRIIIHFESKIINRELGIRKLINKVHKKGKQIGLALNPETNIAVTIPFLKDLDLVLIMTVQPGWGGQEFKEWTLDKIKFLREKWPDGNIEVDGGVNNENIKDIVKAGANLICIGSYIYKSRDIEEAITRLKE